MTYLNPVQTAVEWLLDHDIPNDRLADALSAQLEYLIGTEDLDKEELLH